MTGYGGKEGNTVGEQELREFQAKLDAWADSLNLGEKALLQVVLERAAGRDVRSARDLDFDFPATAGFAKVVTPFLRELVQSGALSVRPPDVDARAVHGWVQAGDPWVQGA